MDHAISWSERATRFLTWKEGRRCIPSRAYDEGIHLVPIADGGVLLATGVSDKKVVCYGEDAQALTDVMDMREGLRCVLDNPFEVAKEYPWALQSCVVNSYKQATISHLDQLVNLAAKFKDNGYLVATFPQCQSQTHKELVSVIQQRIIAYAARTMAAARARGNNAVMPTAVEEGTDPISQAHLLGDFLECALNDHFDNINKKASTLHRIAGATLDKYGNTRILVALSVLHRGRLERDFYRRLGDEGRTLLVLDKKCQTEEQFKKFVVNDVTGWQKKYPMKGVSHLARLYGIRPIELTAYLREAGRLK